MTIKLSMPDIEGELKPRITVVGVGGAGGNAVNNMIDSNLAGVEFLVCNTDAQALGQSKSERRIQLGTNLTQGLGAGARPDVGRAAAEEAQEETLDHLAGSHMVFITAGMGGGTGTGAAPVIARTTREQGILTVGVVTKPFHFEGQQRMRLAEAGIEELTQQVDTLIIIPNQNLFRVANEKTTFADAFNMADNVLYSGVRGVTDLMVMPGLINLDFADVRTVMSEMGKAMMGTGESEGERRSIDAAEAAISNPLLEDITMEGARGVLINITGGPDMTLFEVDEAANRIREEVDPEANILFGSTFDETMEGKLRVSVVATGIDAAEMSSLQPRPVRTARPTGQPAPAESETPPKADDVADAEPTAEAEANAADVPSAIEPVTPAVEEEAPQSETPIAEAEKPAMSAVPQPAKPAPAARIEPSLTMQRPSTPQPVAAAPAAADATNPAPAPAPKPEQRPEPQTRPESLSRPEPGGRRVPFIPPRPTSPSTGDDSGTGQTHRSAGEQLDDALSQPSRRRSLFERMTGVSRTADMDLRSTTASQPRVQTEPQLQTRPTPAAPPLTEPPAPSVTPENPPAQVQKDEASDEPEKASTTEEEVLDIPAFLRRQAN
jgi:cell division protein FtsZ